MTLVHEAVLIRGEEAETLASETSAIRLLVDSSSTGGALSTQRVTLAAGANGAVPHHHTASTEFFYILNGTVQVLAGDKVLVLGQGDVAVVPPNMPHAFAAAPDCEADLLIVITPGIERFEYFRLLAKVRSGEATLQDLLDSQELYDTHFLDSPVWTQERS
ncbi:MAG: cupin [Amycolatopsis sp.]|jgi:quercetin dioxygenase-like cupin family protein|uniref:cupin domain-containing protein n=1 Tax=Amycolatopsis sp. TaxID=37632 RepID=UPI002603CB0D|nr:cupin domain-containing protein [Amycolatopsis sp.]MCU1684391.1 cupin [Amycolatopsis sp.]